MKDKNNLLDYNVWSCGEYNKNVLEWTNNKNLNINNNWSSIGECNIKLTRISDIYDDYTSTINITNLPEDNYLLSITIYSPYAIGSLRLINIDTEEYVSVGITKSDNPYTTSITINSLENVKIRLINWGKIGDNIYFDNIKLT